MSVYRYECPDCGNVSETHCWQPESCIFCMNEQLIRDTKEVNAARIFLRQQDALLRELARLQTIVTTLSAAIQSAQQSIDSTE